ncbi:MAG: hypothetical protein K5764_02840, partial [Prevotella sp.]|nr:hypothetical protein [Prevotella sp.]
MKKQLNNLAWTKCLLAVMALLLVPKGAWGQTTYYDLWVAGTQVTSDNAGDVFDGDETNDDKVTYNADSKTLTLNGATIRTGNDGIVSNIEELTINLVGENILECSTNTSVVFKTTLEEPTPKIKFTSTSTTAQLQVAFNKDYGALYDGVNLDYNNIFEYVESGVDYDYIQPISYGITISTTDIAEKNVDILNASNVLGDNGTTVSFDSSTNTLTLNGAAISTISYSNESPLIIALSGTNSLEDMIYCEEMTEQPSLTFTKAGSESCSLTMGECSDGIIAGFSSVTCGEGIYLHTITPSKCAGKFFVSAIDGESITSATVSSVVSYPLWVSGTQVTASNASSLLDGKASFADNTLTLNGATLTSNIISNLTSLTIVLNGSNTIELQEGATNSCITTTNSGSTLTFTKGNDTAGLGLNGTNNSGNSIVGGFTSVSFDCLKILGVDAYNYKYAITYDTSDKKYENSDGSAVTKGSIFNFLSGEGTAASPYLITTAAELQSFAGWVNDGTIKDEYIRLEVENNLDCSSLTGFTPIGSSDYYFKGTFDGNSKTISNLEITEIGNVVGLFGNVGSDDFAATIKNLTLSGCTFSGADENGAIAGQLSNGTIQGCTVTGCTITSGATQSPSAGGIAGYMYQGTISGCTVNSSSSTPTKITAYSNYSEEGGYTSAGGVVGWVNKTGDVNISNNSVAGTVNIVGNHTNGIDGGSYVGCIIGQLSGTITLADNTYASTATTSTQGATALSGSTARGIGYNGTDTSYDVLANNGAVLEGLQKITISSATFANNVLSLTGGTITYTPNDRFDSSNLNIYCLPGETATLTFTPTPDAGYLQPTISGVEGATTTYYDSSDKEVTDASDAAYTTYSFTMPESDVTISATFPVDISGYYVSAPDASYTGQAYETVTVKESVDSESSLTEDTDYTIKYQLQVADGSTWTNIEAADVKNVGTYQVVVTGTGNYGGSKVQEFKITKAQSLSFSTPPSAKTGLTYTGEAQALVKAGEIGITGVNDLVEYKIGENGTYSTEIPTATDAGSYDVYYYLP